MSSLSGCSAVNAAKTVRSRRAMSARRALGPWKFATISPRLRNSPVVMPLHDASIIFGAIVNCCASTAALNSVALHANGWRIIVEL